MSEGCDVLLRCGGIAHVRPLCTTDREALHELVDRSSERSAYLRFFTGDRRAAHAYMDRITSDQYPGHALVAHLKDRLVAVAEYVPLESGRADLAILIDDAVHGHGLGTLLLEHLALNAAEHGIRELVADVLGENRPMLRMLRDLGLDVTHSIDGETLHVSMTAEPTSRLREAIAARDHVAGRASLTRVLAPRSVAVIGASRDERAVGHKVLRNLIDGGFRGPIHPVNPNATEVAGLACQAKVPDGVDLAVVAVPARHVLEVARDCASAGVAGLVVLTSGFAEPGQRDTESQLLRICRTAGIRLIGPNCLGVVNTGVRLNAGFLPHRPVRGRVALMSQPGTVGAALLERLEMSSFVSVGDKADVSGNDLLEYWEDDPGTDVIGLCLESFGNPRKFARIARRVGARKPILLVKSGRSRAGERAVRSHVAATATPDVAVDALTRAAGVIRVDNVHELIDTAKLLAAQPLPAGRRVAIVGDSGEHLAMAANACECHGLIVPELLEAGAAALGNPVDLTAGVGATEIGSAVKALVASPDVDVVLVVCTSPFGDGLDATRQAIAEGAKGADKTVLACVAGHDGLDGHVPGYAFPEQAVKALSHMVRYAEWRRRPIAPAIAPVPLDRGTAREIVRAELEAHPEGCWLSPAVAARLLRCYGVPLAETVEVSGPEPAAAAAASVGLPAVLKAVGPVHKGDIGGVRLGLRTSDEVRQAYHEMSTRIGQELTGAVVQRMLPAGVEITVGGVNYPAFGPLIMVSMGGVTADLPTSHAFQVPPVTDATDMIGELRCAPLLRGYRGSPPVDLNALADQLARIGRLLDDLPQVAELEFNPVLVTPDGATTVDARIRVVACEPPPSPLLRRLR
ncbi:GNAT family N-acetyltransferase [Nonomuraea basaltis]|nr:GNAT family N-acetyltransferase [Nonomuraea basaltis]